MPLVLGGLQSALESLFLGQYVFPGETKGRWPATHAEAGEAWAALYRAYAEGAQSCKALSPLPTALDAAEATLRSLLTVLFQAGAAAPPPGVNPSTTANGIASGLTAFWLTPPVAFPPDGLVTVVAGTAALAAGLLSTWASNLAIPPPGVTAQAAAAQHAALIDAFTHTVAVAHTAPPPCALPLV